MFSPTIYDLSGQLVRHQAQMPFYPLIGYPIPGGQSLNTCTFEQHLMDSVGYVYLWVIV